MAERDYLTEVPSNMRFLNAPPPPEIKGRPGPVRAPKLKRHVNTEHPGLATQLTAMTFHPLFGQFTEDMVISDLKDGDPFSFLPQKNEKSKTQE